ncbi:hypothetical protein PGB90_005601 [Kerria lacca]
MFTYRVHSRPHFSSNYNKMQRHCHFKVDYEEFHKPVGLHIRNDRTLDANQEADVNADPNQMDTSYETDDLFLSAYLHIDENDPGVETLDAPMRKMLVLTVMKVFYEDIPKRLKEQRKIEQAKNIKKKEELKEIHKQKSLEGMKKKTE